LNEKQMFRLLHRVVKAENESLDREIIDQIILDSQGHPRNALQILDQTLAAPKEDRLKVAKRQAEMQSATIELCRALLQRTGGWKKVRSILAGLKEEEPESVRRAVLGYCSSILMNGENDRAALILETMLEPVYDSGWPGIVYYCYSILK
jgi:DNA polymerase III gamma/tau subunit